MKSRAEKKAELMRVAEAQIEALLEWVEETEAPNLGQIEETVLQMRQKLGEQMALAVLEGQEAVRPLPEPSCPGCGQRMGYKGQKRKGISSWVGELELKRGYFYCDHCQRGLFPPG